MNDDEREAKVTGVVLGGGIRSLDDIRGESEGEGESGLLHDNKEGEEGVVGEVVIERFFDFFRDVLFCFFVGL